MSWMEAPENNLAELFEWSRSATHGAQALVWALEQQLEGQVEGAAELAGLRALTDELHFKLERAETVWRDHYVLKPEPSGSPPT